MVLERLARTIAEDCRNLRHHRETGAGHPGVCPWTPGSLMLLGVVTSCCRHSFVDLVYRGVLEGHEVGTMLLGIFPPSLSPLSIVLPYGLLLREPMVLSKTIDYPIRTTGYI